MSSNGWPPTSATGRCEYWNHSPISGSPAGATWASESPAITTTWRCSTTTQPSRPIGSVRWCRWPSPTPPSALLPQRCCSRAGSMASSSKYPMHRTSCRASSACSAFGSPGFGSTANGSTTGWRSTRASTVPSPRSFATARRSHDGRAHPPRCAWLLTAPYRRRSRFGCRVSNRVRSRCALPLTPSQAPWEPRRSGSTYEFRLSRST